METQNPRKQNPYRVPDGYFSDLRHTLRERIAADVEAQMASPPTLWQRVKGLVGFAAAFGCLVLFATIGYYFTGYQAQQPEQLALQQDDVTEALLAYQFYSEDLEALELYMTEDPEVEAQQQEQFAADVTEYLDRYGYGLYLEAALNGEEPY